MAGLALPFCMQAQGLYITSGARFVSNGSPKIVINNGGIRNEGSFTQASSSLVFTGNCATSGSFISGSGTMTLNDLELNKSVNGLQLNRNISLAGNLSFTSGDSLFLNAFNLDLGTTGTLIGETGSKRITGRSGGYIQRTETLNAPDWANPGNIGVSIKSAANLGSTVIRRYPIQIAGTSVYRYFNIAPANNSTLNAQVRVQYFEQELAGIPETALGVFVSYDNAVTWTDFLYDGVDYTNNYIQKGGFTSFSLLTLSDFNYALAVKLNSFTAIQQGNTALLHWETVQESPGTVYTLERSLDGQSFSPLFTQKGKILLNNQYSYTDALPESGNYFYRLYIQEPQQQFYSAVCRLSFTAASSWKPGWYPNPASQQVLLQYNSSISGMQLISVTDLSGKAVYQKMLSVTKGKNNIVLQLPRLQPGTYCVSPSSVGRQTGLLLIR